MHADIDTNVLRHFTTDFVEIRHITIDFWRNFSHLMRLEMNFANGKILQFYK